jgi:hypothetical protein
VSTTTIACPGQSLSAGDARLEVAFIGGFAPNGIGQGEHPLPDGRFGQHAVDEVGGRIGHSPTPTRRTEPPALAREGDEPIVVAGVAVDAQESMGEDAALEIGADLALDEAGDGRSSGSCEGEEGLELVADDGVEAGLLGVVSCVRVDGKGSAGDAVVWRGERSGIWLLSGGQSSGESVYTPPRAREQGSAWSLNLRSGASGRRKRVTLTIVIRPGARECLAGCRHG